MTYDYDLVIGAAGSGGLPASKRAASYGAKVIAELDLVGGTCDSRLHSAHGLWISLSSAV